MNPNPFEGLLCGFIVFLACAVLYLGTVLVATAPSSSLKELAAGVGVRP